MVNQSIISQKGQRSKPNAPRESHEKMVEIRRLYVFLALFTFVYFLESIGGTYMVTAVQNIERHFQIPSKLSGFLVSAHDISYVLTVILVSYYGSRGNRAKWIGFGTILMAVAHILTASPNFLFPPKVPQLNITQVEDRLRPDPQLLTPNATVHDFFHYAPIRDRIPGRVREMVLAWLDHPDWVKTASTKPPRLHVQNFTKSEYAIDEPLVAEMMRHSDLLLSAQGPPQVRDASQALAQVMRQFVENRKEMGAADLKTMRRAAVAPFSTCHKLINNFRLSLQSIKCGDGSSNFGPLATIFLAMLVLGLGRTMPWSLGIPLIDDNVKKQQMPVYFAMINFFKILGPICGFLIGSMANKFYYTFPAHAPKGLKKEDPTWIGAWWLGFLFIGVVMVGPSLALFFFPQSSRKKSRQHLNGGPKWESGKREGEWRTGKPNGRVGPREGGGENGNGKMANGSARKEKTKLALFDRHIGKANGQGKDGGGFGEFLRSYKAVLGSRVYLGASIARVLDVFAFKGYMVFLPKYLENHYGIPQYKVHIYMAVFGVLGFALGVLSGGFMTRKMRMNGRKAALFVLAVSLVNTALFGLKALLGCNSVVNSIGLNREFSNFNFTTVCNAQCGCEAAKLYPVCDSAGQSYYSPCHAGCRHVGEADRANSPLEFTECECVQGGTVSKAFCQDDCAFMRIAFFVTIVLGAFVAGTGVVPGMLLLLRSVPPETRSPALGLQGLLVSAIGTLPSPVFWGWLVDSACQVWDSDCQGSRGACQIYDPFALRMRMHWSYVAIRLFSLLADVFVCIHAKGLNLQQEEGERADRRAEGRAAAPEGTTAVAMAMPVHSTPVDAIALDPIVSSSTEHF